MNARGTAPIACAPMGPDTRADALSLLGAFLDTDPHYSASKAAYGDGGRDALLRALDLFLARPELGFVWLAHAGTGGARSAVGACVVACAISTSRGALVAKLDDVTVAAQWQRAGVGAMMIDALRDHLRARGFRRIDSACHRDNVDAWRFYERRGFRPLGEERIALLLDAS